MVDLKHLNILTSSSFSPYHVICILVHMNFLALCNAFMFLVQFPLCSFSKLTGVNSLVMLGILGLFLVLQITQKTTPQQEKTLLFSYHPAHVHVCTTHLFLLQFPQTIFDHMHYLSLIPIASKSLCNFTQRFHIELFSLHL